MPEVDLTKLADMATSARDHQAQAAYLAAYREMFKDDPLQAQWETGMMRAEVRAKAHIFTVMARGFEDALGKEKGRQAVRATREKQGTAMGKAMAAVVKARGGKLDLHNYFEEFWRYYAWSPKCDVTKEYDAQGNLTVFRLRVPCPIGDFLRENAPDREFSRNYCDLDEFIAHAYNPNIRYTRHRWIPGGDLYCDIQWSLDADGIL